MSAEGHGCTVEIHLLASKNHNAQHPPDHMPGKWPRKCESWAARVSAKQRLSHLGCQQRGDAGPRVKREMRSVYYAGGPNAENFPCTTASAGPSSVPILAEELRDVGKFPAGETFVPLTSELSCLRERRGVNTPAPSTDRVKNDLRVMPAM